MYHEQGRSLSGNIPEAMDWPRLFTKKDLCRLFNLSKRTLYSRLLTPDVLESAGMTVEECKAVRGGFTLAQSTRLKTAILQCSNS